MADASIAASNAPYEKSEILKLAHDLNGVYGHLENLINTALILIDDKDDMDEVRSVLAAALRYCGDVWEIAEAIEIADCTPGAKGAEDE